MAAKNPRDLSKKALQAEREWRERLILAARKMQLASQSFSEDIASLRDVTPGMDRLEKALRDSEERLTGIEDRLLAEIMRRLEERSVHAEATEAKRELAQARNELQQREQEFERLAAGQRSVAEMQAMMESMQAEYERALATMNEAHQREMAGLKERLQKAELGATELEAKHQEEIQQFADHAQVRVRKLEDDILKKRRGIKALTEENIQLQIQLGQAKKEIEERKAEVSRLESQVHDTEPEADDTRAAIEAQTSVDMGEPPGALPHLDHSQAEE